MIDNSDFAHLHIHNEYSQLDGFGTADAYAAKAARLGYKYLGLTNHGNIDGLIKFQQACKKYDIKPVLGCELYLTDDATKKKKRTGHACVWIKDYIGFDNICRMLTFANTEGFYYRPRVSFEMLLDNAAGLIISTACMQSFLLMKDGVSLFRALYDTVGSKNLYLELMPHLTEDQIALNKLCIDIAHESGCDIIASNDCHYINRGDYKAQEVLLAIQTKAKWEDPKRWRFSMRGLHLRTAKEMQHAFEKQGFYKEGHMLNTLDIAERCQDFNIEQQDVKLPRIKGVKLKDESKKLESLCRQGFQRLFGRKIQEQRGYNRRFKEELELIKQKRFVRYFLIVWELCDWCKRNSVLIGPGRGSVGGSLIAYLLGITAVDPIKHGLLFSRFINEDRIDLPDIDIDFEHTKRHLVRKHLEELYGKDKVAGVSSFNRMKARAVIRDVSRVFAVPAGEVDNFAKLIEDNDDHTGIQDAIDQHKEGKQFNAKYPHVVKLATKLEGQIRGYGQHAAALVISRNPIGTSGRCNLREKEDVTLVNWEKDDTEYVGLMKLDALGLNLLSILAETRRLIKINHIHDIDFNKINLEDKAVLKEITKGNNVGLFQLNTWAMTNLIKEIGKLTFRQICDATALVRPGPYASGMTDEYIKRKRGKDWDRRHHVYEKITEDTYGLLVYQEQVMDVIHKVAGLPYSTADKIRKIIGKKRDRKEFEQYKRTFVKGCMIKKIFSRREALEFWDGLQEWARYGFNLSHATEYALLGYWCGWLKRYFPTEFICASLTYGAQQKKRELVEEAYRLGLTLVLPKVGISDPIGWIAKDRKLYIPFVEVKGIGEKKALIAVSLKDKKTRDKKFFNKDKEEPARHPGKFGELLDMIGAYDEEEKTQLSDEVQGLFDFRVVTNPREYYRKLYRIFGGNIRLDRLDATIQGQPKQLKTLQRRIIFERDFPGHDTLHECRECELREECTLPVPPSSGQLNIVLVGEAPGQNEDEEGAGFVGGAGRYLWNTLKRFKLYREMFHVTNINKCWPSESRKPNKDQIKTCADLWFSEELKRLKARLVLAFGNTPLFYFTGRTSGITNLSGRAQWNEEYNAWLAWCVHPAAVLHNPDNETYYRAGILNFVRMLRALGIKGAR